ncbi:MAG: isoaspartyl peptidase/L-asparaginase [Balneolaceae bacterium]|nr:MAG: isoaspartyl peptidase/L-asparaginase [Balneolaceae bacterium]
MKFYLLSVILLFTIITGCSPSEPAKAEWALALHGGAGTISKEMPDSLKEAYYDGLREALRVGEIILREGGSALDAVEQVVRRLEDNPLFNAGKGAVFTLEGTHELDAAIMDGSTLAAGAVTGLTTVKNPVSLVRMIMEESPHIFFSGAGAETFADMTGVERVENSYFFTENRYRQWQRTQTGEATLLNDQENSIAGPLFTEGEKFGTVGAVALDKNGNLAAATSTGGMTNKQFGRVGDVPIIGSGTYANSLVAVSATGWGEQIMRNVSAATIANYMEFRNTSLENAMRFVLNERLNPGDAGFVAVDREGNISMQMNTAGMYRGAVNSLGERSVMIWEEE